MTSLVFQAAAAVAGVVPPGQRGSRCGERRDRALDELVGGALGLAVMLPGKLDLVPEAQRSARCDDDAIPAVRATAVLAREHVVVDPGEARWKARQSCGILDG